MSTTVAGPSPIGNEQQWQRLQAWIRSSPTPLCVLRGPPGVGKTMGVAHAASSAGRQLRVLHCGDLTSGAVKDLLADLTVGKPPPVFLLDDAEALTEPCRPSMRALLAKLPTAARVVLTCNSAWTSDGVQLALRRLEPPELTQIARRYVAQGVGSEAHIARCVEACRGDARFLRNLLALGQAALLDRATDPYDCARRLLYGRCDVEKADELSRDLNVRWLSDVIHRNYVDAAELGRVGNIDALADRADRLSLAVTLEPTAGRLLAATTTLGLGRKLAEPDMQLK